MRKFIQATRYKLQDTKATTLVEFMVALSIFVIFVVVAIGGFIQALNNQRLILKLAAATDNMSLTLEQIMREIRVANNFYATGGNQLRFDRLIDDGVNTTNKTVTYLWDKTNYDILRTVSDINGGNLVSAKMTADNVKISYFNVSANKSVASFGPCRITMVIGVTARDQGLTITNYIQTTASSRIFTDTCSNQN
jgi:Tfp pilus assembly protein PilW